MRIAMLLSTVLPPREGIGFYAWNLSQCLRDMGHDVSFITRRGPNEPFQEVIDGFQIWRPKYYPIYPLHVNLHELFVNRLVKVLEPNIDLFHIHSPLPPAIKTKRPVMVTFHSSVYDDLKDLRVNSLSKLIMKLQVPFSHRIEKRLLRLAKGVNAVSPYLSGVIDRYADGHAKVRVTWNGVDTQTFFPNGLPRKKFVLTTGRLNMIKGLKDLIAAAKLVNEKAGPTQFLIAGEGPIRAELEREIAAQGLDGQVELIGHISDRKQLIELYQQAALFVSASHKEGLPTVMLEAMSTGCPVVVTAVGGNPDVITHGMDGMLVPPREPEALAAAIIQMLSNPARLAEMGEAGRRTVESRYSWNAITRQYLDQYEEILGGSAA